METVFGSGQPDSEPPTSRHAGASRLVTPSRHRHLQSLIDPSVIESTPVVFTAPRRYPPELNTRRPDRRVSAAHLMLPPAGTVGFFHLHPCLLFALLTIVESL